MNSTSVQTNTPVIAAEQWMLDRMLKHMRKLRWIGNEQEAEKLAQVLRDIRLPRMLGHQRGGEGEAKDSRPAKDVEREAAAAGGSSSPTSSIVW
ncbi:MAG TPA: hypothetical protein VH684_19800 [Xanthobacteraceae bacterium]|jgi:hypothetical protein